MMPSAVRMNKLGTQPVFQLGNLLADGPLREVGHPRRFTHAAGPYDGQKATEQSGIQALEVTGFPYRQLLYTI